MSQEIELKGICKYIEEKNKYKGRKNKLVNENKEFVRICKLSQKELKNELTLFLFELGYAEIHSGNGFIYAKGEMPIVLTAHMDTVHKERVNTTYEYKNATGDYIISSPQGIGGDDRCGIYMIMNILRKGYRPYIVFCEDEEIGCVGSARFCQTDYIKELRECKYIIELDRAHSKDAVYYDCDNPEFEAFITETTGYKTEWGSCSDISELCPAIGIAGVNLSCGYYNAHQLDEYVNMTEMENTQDVVEKLLNTECVQYEYIEAKHYYGNYYGNYYGTSYNYKQYNKGDLGDEIPMYLEIIFTDSDGMECVAYAEGSDELSCWGNFFIDYPAVCFNDIIQFEIIA